MGERIKTIRRILASWGIHDDGVAVELEEREGAVVHAATRRAGRERLKAVANEIRAEIRDLYAMAVMGGTPEDKRRFRWMARELRAQLNIVRGMMK